MSTTTAYLYVTKTRKTTLHTQKKHVVVLHVSKDQSIVQEVLERCMLKRYTEATKLHT